MILLGEHILHREHDARELAARGDAVDRAQLLAHVRGHEEADMIRAGRVRRLLREIDREADLAHVELLQLGEDLRGEHLRRLMAPRGESPGCVEHGAPGLLLLLFDRASASPAYSICSSSLLHFSR